VDHFYSDLAALVTDLTAEFAVLVVSKTFAIEPMAPNKPAVSAGMIIVLDELPRLSATFACAFKVSSATIASGFSLRALDIAAKPCAIPSCSRLWSKNAASDANFCASNSPSALSIVACFIPSASRISTFLFASAIKIFCSAIAFCETSSARRSNSSSRAFERALFGML